MRAWVTFGIMTVAAGVALCEVGDLAPIPVEPPSGWRNVLHAWDQEQFAKPSEDAGTLHKGAMVVTLRDDLKIAIDANDPNGRGPNLVRLDFTGKGDFRNAPTLPLKWDRKEGGYRIGPGVIEVRRGERTIPVSVNGNYYRYSQFRRVLLQMGTGLEGSCRFGDTVYPVRIVDLTGDLDCDDKPTVEFRGGFLSAPVTKGDRVVVRQRHMVGADTDGTDAPLGYLLPVDGAWYRVKVSEDGTKISANPVKEATARVRLPAVKGWALLMGTQHEVRVWADKGPAEVPLDEYIVAEYNVEGLPSAPRVVIQGRSATCALEIEPGDTPFDLPLTGPLRAKPEVHRPDDGGSEVMIQLALFDALGGRVRLLRDANGKQPPPPPVEIFTTDGTKVHTGKMAYG